MAQSHKFNLDSTAHVMKAQLLRADRQKNPILKFKEKNHDSTWL